MNLNGRELAPGSQTTFYDSNDRELSIRALFKSFWRTRNLLILLVRKDLSIRYKKSILGMFWTLLNPLVTSLVLWFVFIEIFKGRLPNDTQFAPYVLAGILIITFFSQGFNQAADSITQSTGILKKIYVPPQVFALAGAVSNAINFCFGLVALAIISIITGDGISPFFPLTIIVIILLLMSITGLGLIISIVYIRYDDVRNVVSILISFMMYLSPVFYPIEILSKEMQTFVNLNPLTSFLKVFRFVFSNTGSPSLGDWIYISAFSFAILFFGIKFFAKSWPRTVVMM